MLRFVLFGFPVRVHGIFWLTSLLLSQPSGFDRASLVRLVTWTGIVFVSILVHELGLFHAGQYEATRPDLFVNRPVASRAFVNPLTSGDTA